VQIIAERAVVRVLEENCVMTKVGAAVLDLVAQAIPVDVTAFRAGDMPFRNPATPMEGRRLLGRTAP
jgi:hypothetical protein